RARHQKRVQTRLSTVRRVRRTSTASGQMARAAPTALAWRRSQDWPSFSVATLKRRSRGEDGLKDAEAMAVGRHQRAKETTAQRVSWMMRREPRMKTGRQKMATSSPSRERSATPTGAKPWEGETKPR